MPSLYVKVFRYFMNGRFLFFHRFSYDFYDVVKGRLILVFHWTGLDVRIDIRQSLD